MNKTYFGRTQFHKRLSFKFKIYSHIKTSNQQFFKKQILPFEVNFRQTRVALGIDSFAID